MLMIMGMAKHSIPALHTSGKLAALEKLVQERAYRNSNLLAREQQSNLKDEHSSQRKIGGCYFALMEDHLSPADAEVAVLPLPPTLCTDPGGSATGPVWVWDKSTYQAHLPCSLAHNSHL